MPVKFYSLWIITESGINLDGFLQILRERGNGVEIYLRLRERERGNGRSSTACAAGLDAVAGAWPAVGQSFEAALRDPQPVPPVKKLRDHARLPVIGPIALNILQNGRWQNILWRHSCFQFLLHEKSNNKQNDDYHCNQSAFYVKLFQGCSERLERRGKNRNQE